MGMTEGPPGWVNNMKDEDVGMMPLERRVKDLEGELVTAERDITRLKARVKALEDVPGELIQLEERVKSLEDSRGIPSDMRQKFDDR